MSQPINCRELVSRVRFRVHDPGSKVWTDDTDILRSADDQLRTLFSKLMASGESWFQDSMDVPLGSMLTPEPDVYEYELPDFVLDPQQLETIIAGKSTFPPIPKLSMENKDTFRDSAFIAGAGWLFVRYGNSGAIQIRGGIRGAAAVRIWFIRALGPLTYGTATGGSTTTLAIGTTTGAHKIRPDIYKNMQVEVTADVTQPSNVGSIRRVSSFTSPTMTFTQPFPAAINSTTQWAIVVPIAPHQVDLLTQETAVELMVTSGNPEDYQLGTDRRAQLRQDFQQTMAQRQTGEPRRSYSSRSRRQ